MYSKINETIKQTNQHLKKNKIRCWAYVYARLISLGSSASGISKINKCLTGKFITPIIRHPHLLFMSAARAVIVNRRSCL